jgi:hypothetical protein
VKILCKINKGNKACNFQPCRVVVEVAPEKIFEVDLTLEGYQCNDRVDIKSAGVTLNTRTLTVSCSHVSVPTLLLHIELCKFVMDQTPELAEVKFK